jgi:hypothetical protein
MLPLAMFTVLAKDKRVLINISSIINIAYIIAFYFLLKLGIVLNIYLFDLLLRKT